MHHDLKCQPQYFTALWMRIKPFEIRFNDRQYGPGDTFALNEYDPRNDTFSGRKIHGAIKTLFPALPGLESGYVIFTYEETGREDPPRLVFEEGEA